MTPKALRECLPRAFETCMFHVSTAWNPFCLPLPLKISALMPPPLSAHSPQGSFSSPGSESSLCTSGSKVHFSGLSDRLGRTPLLATNWTPSSTLKEGHPVLNSTCSPQIHLLSSLPVPPDSLPFHTNFHPLASPVSFPGSRFF